VLTPKVEKLGKWWWARFVRWFRLYILSQNTFYWNINFELSTRHWSKFRRHFPRWRL